MAAKILCVSERSVSDSHGWLSSTIDRLSPPDQPHHSLIYAGHTSSDRDPTLGRTCNWCVNVRQSWRASRPSGLLDSPAWLQDLLTSDDLTLTFLWWNWISHLPIILQESKPTGPTPLPQSVGFTVTAGEVRPRYTSFLQIFALSSRQLGILKTVFHGKL